VTTHASTSKLVVARIERSEIRGGRSSASEFANSHTRISQELNPGYAGYAGSTVEDRMAIGIVRRREVIGLGSAAAAWPLTARAQQPATMPVIGFLNVGSPGRAVGRLRVFAQSLSEAGYVEGRNVAIEYRWAENQNDRLPALAADLVRRQVRMIVTSGGSAAAVAAKAATATIPIVFQTGADPIAAGLVASLNRPGGNLTGVTALNAELAPKLLEVLHEAVLSARTIAILTNPTGANMDGIIRDMRAAARMFGVQLEVLNASTESDFERVFAELIQLRAGGLVISANALFGNRSPRLAALALSHAMPAISFDREFVPAGGLMSYGGGFAEVWRTVGAYTARILKGEKPADLPVQQITKVELVINMKTAKALGITFPFTLLGRADEVIE
jgi:putative ABC transport system substrate-binding protein